MRRGKREGRGKRAVPELPSSRGLGWAGGRAGGLLGVFSNRHDLKGLPSQVLGSGCIAI